MLLSCPWFADLLPSCPSPSLPLVIAPSQITYHQEVITRIHHFLRSLERSHPGERKFQPMKRSWMADYGKPPPIATGFGYGISFENDDSDDDMYGTPPPGLQRQNLGRLLMYKDHFVLDHLEKATHGLANDLHMWKLSRLTELRTAKLQSMQACKQERDSTEDVNRKLRDLELAFEKQENETRRSTTNKQPRGKEAKVHGVV